MITDHIDAQPTDEAGLLYLAVTVALPIVVAVVTKQTSWGGAKAYVLLALSTLNSFLFTWYDAAQANVDIDFKGVVVGAVVTFVVAAATHAGLLKPAGITGSTGKVQTAIPGGIV